MTLADRIEALGEQWASKAVIAYDNMRIGEVEQGRLMMQAASAFAVAEALRAKEAQDG